MIRMNRIRGAARTVVGCGVVLGLATVAQAADAQKKIVTFTKDVAPILQEKCQSCHRPGTVAPMSLLTYDEARPWARSIKMRVAAREMPPWHISRNVGIQEFKGDRSLTDSQIATIVAWVDGGALQGNPKDMPPPLEFPDGDAWQIGKPDLIITANEDQIVPATGPDMFINIYADLPLTEDRYFKAVETRVSKDGRRVVHHAITNLAPMEQGERPARGAKAKYNASDDNPGDSESRTTGTAETFLNEYALGKGGEVFTDGTARLLKAGSRISFNMHLHSVGEEVGVRPTVGFVLYPRGYVPKHLITDLTLRELDRVDIPPGELSRSEIYYRLPKAARIAAYQPHMHIRGKAMCMEAIYPDATREMLNCVDHFDFNWHVMYQYQENVAPLLPAGTLLHLSAVHDNTMTRTNPDPALWIGWGSRSFDEMTAAHIGFEFLSDQDYQQLLAVRKAGAQAPKVTQQQQ
jgi:hypothetical protein